MNKDIEQIYNEEVLEDFEKKYLPKKVINEVKDSYNMRIEVKFDPEIYDTDQIYNFIKKQQEILIEKVGTDYIDPDRSRLEFDFGRFDFIKNEFNIQLFHCSSSKLFILITKLKRFFNKNSTINMNSTAGTINIFDIMTENDLMDFLEKR